MLASGEVVVVPTHLPWYPDKLAWQLNVTRKDIRRQERYHRLHDFLVAETESESISRQDTVSMLPPLVLDVKPHHTVLDMCAAPGSKVICFSFTFFVWRLYLPIHHYDSVINALDLLRKTIYFIQSIDSPYFSIVTFESRDAIVIPDHSAKTCNSNTMKGIASWIFMVPYPPCTAWVWLTKLRTW